jgi:predicted double-glycine peptidase
MRLKALYEDSPAIAKVPSLEQETDSSCGAAAVLSVLQYFGVADGRTEKDLYKPLDLHYDGADIHNMVNVLKDRGLNAEFEKDVDIQKLINWMSADKIAIVEIQAYAGKNQDPAKTKDSGHYVVVIGFDDKKAYFMDSMMKDHEYGFLPIDEFVARWHGLGSKKHESHQTIFISSNGKRLLKVDKFDAGKIK